MSASNEETHYAVLGVAKTATTAEIQSAFKKRARVLHPDVNKASDAEEKFKRLVEAYEVLKDEEKRARYDALGKNARRRTRSRPSSTASAAEGKSRTSGRGGRSGFEDLFNSENPFDYILRQEQRKKRERAARDREVQLGISLEQAYNGTTLSITLEAPSLRGSPETQRFKIKIPPGAKTGDRLELQDPEVVVVLKIEENARFEIDGRDLTTTLDVAPWEAVLGAEVEMISPGGSPMKVRVPAGTMAGQKLRLRGLGLPLKPGKDGEPGDLYVIVRIVVPKMVSEQARALWKELSELSEFAPRS